MTLTDLAGYLDDEAYTVRVGELRALLADVGKGEAVAKPIGYGKKTQLDAIGKNGSALLYSVACPDEDWDVLVYLAAPPRWRYAVKHWLDGEKATRAADAAILAANKGKP